MEFDFTKTYRDPGSPGIAWRVTGYEEVADEDTEWTGMKVPTGNVIAHMVGDDRDHVFDPDDLEAIPESAYCRECGQIGCGWRVGEEEG